MTRDSRDPPVSDGDNTYYGISKADVDAWAERERQRRRAWLDGPSEEDKRAWAARQKRQRRVVADDPGAEEDFAEGRRVIDRMQVDTVLALVGAASTLVDAPYRLIGNLVRAGRDWEDQMLTSSRRRRRVRFGDED
jgi:hypothetical protein